MPECTHERTVFVGGKCSDMCSTRFHDGTRLEGYAPRIPGLGGGDDIDVKVCIDCCKVIGFTTEGYMKAMADALAEEEEHRRERERKKHW